VGADFVWRMEDVLDLDAQPYDPRRPVVRFDGQPRRLIAEVRVPPPAAPGRPERVDDEYRRQGTANRFLTFGPVAGRRHVAVTERRTSAEFAHQMRALVDVPYPDAERIAVGLDNLSTHSPAALYQSLPPTEARRLLERLQFHDTPKHGSRLNMAELEVSVLGRQCLDRRISDQEALRREITAWREAHNAARAVVQWRFTVTTARNKLHRLYPA
jgi:hypothetical protein